MAVKDFEITPDTTVREINMRYPAAAEIFAKYGIAGCGGKFGPPEPISLFAQAHNAEVSTLIEELEKFINELPEKPAAEVSHEIPLKDRLYSYFIKWALISALTGGTLWGVFTLTLIALRKSFDTTYLSFSQAHGEVQIYGWVGLFILGFAYHVIPRFKNVPLKYENTGPYALGLILISLVLRFLGQPFLNYGAVFEGALLASGILLISGYSLFLLSMIATIRSCTAAPEFYEKYIIASLIWGLGSVVYNFIITFTMFEKGSIYIPADLNPAFRHIQLYGFTAMMILGVSMRILSTFMGLLAVNQRLANTAFYIFNAGIVTSVAGLLWNTAQITALGYTLEFISVLQAISGLNIAKKPVAKIDIVGVDNAYIWYIKAAYIWFVASIVMITGSSYYELLTGNITTHAYIGAYRHAITVGFITMMILGVGQRIIPIFNGTYLYSNRLMRISFFLINIGCLMRVGFQILTEYLGKWVYAPVGISGYFELTAIGLFSFNIYKTLKGEEETEESEDLPVEKITGSTKIRELLKNYPEAREILYSSGITKINDHKDIEDIPRFATVKLVSLFHGINTEKVLNNLKEGLRRRREQLT